MESVGNSIIQTLGYADTSSNFTPGNFPNIFDGTPEDTANYGMVYITCHADASGIIRAMHSMDNSTWDFIDVINYPGVTDTGLDISIGTTIQIKKDLKANWYKSQFEYQDTDPSAECNLRMYTVFHTAATPAEPHFVKLYPTVPIDVTISGTSAVNVKLVADTSVVLMGTTYSGITVPLRADASGRIITTTVTASPALHNGAISAGQSTSYHDSIGGTLTTFMGTTDTDMSLTVVISPDEIFDVSTVDTYEVLQNTPFYHDHSTAARYLKLQTNKTATSFVVYASSK